MFNQELYLKSIDFAAKAHKDQKVPGKNYSYVVHLSNVCMEVIGAIFNSDIYDPDLAIQCALLHDTIEDTDISYNDILNEFGEKVAEGVKALTKDKILPKEEQIGDCLKRILKQSKEIGIVKMADRITNLQKPPEHWDDKKKNIYLKEAELILEKLKNCNIYLSDRLKQKILNYKKNFIND